jgi:hypothetical protein
MRLTVRMIGCLIYVGLHPEKSSPKEIDMKILLLALCLTLLLAERSPQIATSANTDNQANPETMGIIKQISVALHLLLIQTAEGKKAISVVSGALIIIDGREASLENLKEGQLVKVKLSGDTSKAMTIEAS